MKLLYITNLPAPYKRSFFRELSSLGYDLTVLYERRKADNRNDKWYHEETDNFKEVYLRGVSVGEEDALCVEAIKYVLDKQYERIIINGYSTPTTMLTIFFGKKWRRNMYLAIDGILNTEEGIIKRLIKNSIFRGIYGFLSPSDECDRYLEEHHVEKNSIYRYPFSSIKKKSVLDSPLSITEKKQYKEKIGTRKQDVILCVGQFIHRKGIDLLLEASSNLKGDFDIYVVGGEYPIDEYTDIINKYGLSNIKFIPFQRQDTLKDYYLAADMFVLPTREDIWGLVINEAMAYALPVITTDRCGAGLELIQNGQNGFIVQSENIQALCSCMQKIISNAVLRADMSKNALSAIEGYTIENMALKISNILSMQ